MTTHPFERLLYTDCPAGGGRRGSNGFQIQAQSPGVDPEQERVAVRSLLYDTQSGWDMAERPVESWPLGFAHVGGTTFGTAQSRYLGREVTGGRFGNHLADCLLTRDAELYGALRPAQLWRAGFWRAVPWPTVDCPPFDGFLEPGPLDTESVAGWLREHPAWTDPLARLVTVLGDPGGRPVVIVAEEPEEALRWIAAATLLLPARRALDISFKVFVSNLLQADQRVCAVPRSLNQRLAPGQDDGWFVLDAGTGRADAVAVDPRAGFWARHLAGDADPYDVVDAVELAEQLGEQPAEQLGGPPDRAAAWITAWVLTTGRDEDPAALAAWLGDAGPGPLADHGRAVVDRLLAGRPTAQALRVVDQVAGRHPAISDTAGIRHRLLLAEVEEARQGTRPPATPLPALDLGAGLLRDAESVLGSALLLDSSDAAVDALLRVARRHGVRLPPGDLQGRLHDFVAAWVRDPEVDHRPADWELGDMVVDLLHQRLAHDLGRAGPAAVVPALRHLWPHLAARSADTGRPADPGDPLGRHLLAAELTAADPRDQFDRLADALRALEEAGPAPHRAFALEDLQRTLAVWGALGPVTAMLLAVHLPDAVPLLPSVAETAGRGVIEHADRPTRLVAQAAVALDRRSALPRHPGAWQVCESAWQVIRFVDGIDDARSERDLARLVPLLERLDQVDPRLIEIWMPDLVRATLRSRFTYVGSVVLRFLDPDLTAAFLRLWERELRGPDGPVAAVHGIAWYADTVLDAKVRTELGERMATHLQGLDEAHRAEFTTPVYRMLDQEQLGVWAALLDAAGPRRRRGLFRDRNR